MIIATTTRSVFVAPTSGRARLTKPAAYREEARARFAATCDCCPGDMAYHGDELVVLPGTGSVCRYHDPARWERTTSGQSHNGYVIARWACMLAARDGFYLKPPEPLGKPYAPSSPDVDLPF